MASMIQKRRDPFQTKKFGSFQYEQANDRSLARFCRHCRRRTKFGVCRGSPRCLPDDPHRQEKSCAKSRGRAPTYRRSPEGFGPMKPVSRAAVDEIRLTEEL